MAGLKSFRNFENVSLKKIYTCIPLIILLFLLGIGQVNYAQTAVPEYALFRGAQEQHAIDCFSEEFNYADLNFKLVKGLDSELKKTSLILLLSNQQSQLFASVTDFNTFDLKQWLIQNQAFSNSDSLIFKFEMELSSGNSIEQTLSFCLKSSEIDQPYQSENDKSLKPIKRTPDGNPKSFVREKDFVRIPIYFATDRNDTFNADLNSRFGGKRADLKYGICQVSLPYQHQVGQIERPSLWKLEFSEDPKKHIVIQDIKVLNKDSYFKNLSEAIKKSTKKSSFLFVHGYNVSFADAAMRTAQITYDLAFDGEAVFYSWPSQASTVDYTIDEANIEWAQNNIKNFLEDYLTKSGAENIYLVAHSMGNRGLTKALLSLMDEHPELRTKIKEIILAAPDIDADVFKRDIAPQMVSKIKKPITLYVSSDDMALKASKKVHGNARAGDSTGAIVLVKGIDTIDASGIDTSFMSHSYFASTSSIIDDMIDIIKTGKSALYRGKLQLIKLKNQVYYKVKKGI